MVKFKNRFFKAGVLICIFLTAIISSAQTVYNENMYDFTNVEEKENFLVEPPEEEWNRSYGGQNYEEGRSVQQTVDGGYIITGRTSSFGAGGYDVWLIKTDFSGLKEWDKTFGGEKDDVGYSVQQTTDGGYIITGFTYSFGAGGYDVWLIKTDCNGSMEWNETFGGTNFEEGYSVQQTVDGGYIITGRTSSYGEGGHDVWLIKTDSVGNEEWNKTFGGPLYDYGYSVQQTTDGGYIITGFIGSGHFDVWLIKTDRYGFIEWNKIFGGIAADGGYFVQQTADEGYIIIATTASYGTGGSDIWMIKTDPKGDKEWDETFGSTDGYYGFCVQLTADGGYIISGYIYTYSNQNYDALLIKTDSEGNKEWDETFGGTDIEIAYSVQLTADGGYISTGRTDSYGSGGNDVWLIKIETDNNPPYEPSEPIPENNSIDVNIDTNISWTGGDPDNDTIKYDVYFGTTNPPPKIISNQTENYYDPGILEYNTTYYWQIVVWDYYIPCVKGPIWTFTTYINQPPSPPLIDGPKSGKKGQTYLYTFVSEDFEGHNVSYDLYWGDGTSDGWLGPYASGKEIKFNHTWYNMGNYILKAKAKDTFGAESNWSEFEVNIPRNRILFYQWYQWFQKQFPFLDRVLLLFKYLI
ncbi:MAG: hypothetical protein AYK22_05240 [Thermoplasmatales archaeon SG8-52-3]|nr:MAG: hypothetical protein AYK22_05240 [Thermoplasmatales archaeon SG8-52-3]